MNLYQLFLFSVDRTPDNPVIIQDDRMYTYAQLSKEVDRVASSLYRLGLKNGDRVMILLKNRIETVILFWAIQKLGAIFAPINLHSSTEEILYCVNDLETKFIIFENASKLLLKKQKFKERPLLIGLEESLGDLNYDELVKQGITKVEPYPAQDEDIGVILYTSGTSGKPKGVPRSHKNEYTSSMAHIFQCGYQRFERTLGIPTLSHTIGIRSLLTMTLVNGVYIPFPEFDAYKAIKMISDKKISCLFLTPTMYHDIVTHPYANRTDFLTIHSIVYSGGPMSAHLIEKCSELMSPSLFVNLYGSTEVYTFSTCPDVRSKPGSAGKAGIHNRIKLVKLNSDLKISFDWLDKKGEIGEILVNMSSLEAFRGYWNRPDVTKKVIKDGWYFTGDVGYIDDEGDLFVVGRIDEMIISSGENIYPQEIEKVLSQHTSVKEAVVVGEDDERLGQIVTAFIVTDNKELTPQALDFFCKSNNQLPNYKRPRKYIFIKDIPKNSAGKILLRELKDGHFAEEKF
ncbi:class I adenylate-forming enzyme family protein [Cytobacillus sp. Hz8]|uniref:class I adenylate-forming enzyme family protein n=1 Tax=Cytobacillus sp. Hz8 TaxID=3347168 RepID=UPI0035D616D0